MRISYVNFCVCLPWPLEYFIISFLFFLLLHIPRSPSLELPLALFFSGSFSGIRAAKVYNLGRVKSALLERAVTSTPAI